MPRAGVVYTPTAAYERIAQAIRSLPPGTTFGWSELHALTPGVKRVTIAVFLHEKARIGWLERVGFGVYRAGGIHVRTSLPDGMLSQALWAVLSTDPDRRFMTRAELTGETEEYLARPEYRAYRPVSTLLSRWHRHGYLERIGRRGEFRYRLKEGVTEQPLTRN